MEFRFFYHFGNFLIMLKGMFSRPENMKMYWKQFMQQCVDIGVGSFGIVFIISLFMGGVTTLQTAYQLVSPIIPKSTIAQVVRDTIILEFAPTLTSIVLAGVVGSKIASELGNMRISEQIDALEIMGINTKGYLIMPKILAGVLMIPILVCCAGFLGIYGGKEAGVLSGVISSEQFMQGLRQEFKAYNVFFAMAKSYTFGFIIASVSAYYGYNVSGGALEIGKASTTAVVVSCVLILFMDYALTAILL
ncbi:phospholipid/cholesterol/gamma-HCH transport system permease protein [Chitinophaga terrae (ex Kim and Jung 2007)]|uniref:Phospholipid/cholesterol/gamma-HCH transport system permease protein n=1 Tax=Chitinophaga terrae (ex Kim and Jung 2007) TaxID=408074 RepID=A0A1H3Y3F0_9BACT|nr:ABC transporter permease [Chitinophaga terrae (ex Kim and Jung 2007)]GEP90963.1 ABC transporter permease [Chitinophaga terrae (ex Kim and Jung 2007)]SEA06103.1 phospholipid/cholesterol/gamma-HCH transport system permease protein [Chitinophaga terrae (ex Kim and Jung 2007)]